MSALVPIELLLTGVRDASPVVVRLRVPSYEPIVEAGGELLATGTFSVDPCRLADLTSKPQTSFLYACSGRVMSGPYVTAFVEVPRRAE